MTSIILKRASHLKTIASSGRKAKIMESTKFTLNINAEALASDVLPVILRKVIEQLEQEVETGRLMMKEGDFVEWETTKVEVSF